MSQRNTIKDRFYRANTEDNPAITYVNWIKTRNLRGWWWFVTNAPKIGMWMQRQEGMLEYSVTLQSPTSFLIVSYWSSHEALLNAYRSPEHIEMMRKTFKHQDDFVLGNETYAAPIITNYLNEPSGYAKSDPNIAGQNFHDPLANVK